MCRSTSHSQQKFSMNWLGSSTASHSTPLMPATPRSSTRVSRWCRPWPNSWNSVITSSCVNSAGLPPTGRARSCSSGRRPASGCRVAHAGAARWRRPSRRRRAWCRARTGRGRTGRSASPRGVADVEEAHVRVPDRRLRLGDAHADRASRTSSNMPGSTCGLGEVLLHLLVGERVALRAQLLRGVARCPRTRVVSSPSSVARERAQFREVALGEGPRAARPGRAGSRAPAPAICAIFGTSDTSAKFA